MVIYVVIFRWQPSKFLKSPFVHQIRGFGNGAESVWTPEIKMQKYIILFADRKKVMIL